MKPWVPLGRAPIPGSAETLLLFRRENEFSIRLADLNTELMNSRQHGSEEALAELVCPRLGAEARVLVGGLGMGFTLAAALRSLGPGARVTVAELVPEVVDWNRGALGDCAGEPLADPRTRVHLGDVAELLRTSSATFDAVLLDVDNGPEGLTHGDNNWLYTPPGLNTISAALRPGGFLGVWSIENVPRFTGALRRARFDVGIHAVRARGHRGPKHTVWVAQKA